MTLDEAVEVMSTELDAVDVTDLVMESADRYTPPEEPYRYSTGDPRD